MLKMYYAKKLVDVCFTFDDTNSVTHLHREADRFLDEEVRHHVPESFSVVPIEKLNDIPKNWWEAIYYGENAHDNLVADFLQDTEYKEYLRLKAKFE